MANVWKTLRGKGTKEESRFSIDDFYQMYSRDNVIRTHGRYGDSEQIDNDFSGYINGIFKANGPVFAVCEARRAVFSEMRFSYQKLDNGRPIELVGNKNELHVLEHPWPNGTTGELLSRAIQDIDLAGNHYVVREGSGKKARLRRLRPDWVSIILSKDPTEAVDVDVVGYIYKPGGQQDKTKWVIYPIDGSNGAVAHWVYQPDPDAMYRGMSWMTPILKEIALDKQATKHKLKFFENAATPNLAVSFKETVSAEQFEKFMDKLDESKGGVDHAYENLYIGGGADVKVIGATIEQMDFKRLQGLSETRIAMAAGVPATVVGLSEAMGTSAFNDGAFRAAKDSFSDRTLQPLWRSLCAAYAPLVSEFRDHRLWFDMRDIAFLRHDQKELAEIRGIDASTMAKLIMNGYTPDSIIDAIVNEDWTVLKHTGLYSVQLQPPLSKEEAQAAADKKAGKTDAGSTDDDSGDGSDGTDPSTDKPAKDDKAKESKGVKK
jgi:phage portal protein BeeE